MAEISAKINKEEDFKRIRQTGRYWTGKFTRLILVNTSEGQIRIGIVISKRVSKLAVRRNKMRRRISVILTNVISGMGNVSFDLIVSGLSGQCEMEFGELKDEIEKGLVKLVRTNEKSRT